MPTGRPGLSLSIPICSRILGIRDNFNIKGITLNNLEQNLEQYFGDTRLFLYVSEKSLNAAMETLNYFYKLSCLQIHVDQTKTIWKGRSTITLDNDLKLDRNKGDFETLCYTKSFFKMGDQYK